MTQIKARFPLYDFQHKIVTARDRDFALVGGFGASKTFTAFNCILDRARTRDYAVIGYGAQTGSIIRTEIWPEFVSFLRERGIIYRPHVQDRIIEINSGKLQARILFKSYQKPERWTSGNWTDCFLDEFDRVREVLQDGVWTETVGRLRKCRSATRGIFTTPEGFRKTYKLFVVEGIGKLYRVPTYWNTSLPEDFLERLYEQFDEQKVKQYIEGKFINLKGKTAIRAFDQRHIIPRESFDVQPGTIIVGMDFNIGKMAAVCYQYHEDDLVAFDEIFMFDGVSDTEALCEQLAIRYPNHRIIVEPDMTGRNRSATSGRSNFDIIRQFGFQIKGYNNPAPIDRINYVNTAFLRDRVYVCDNCPTLIGELNELTLTQTNDIDKSDPNRSHIFDAGTYPIAREMPIKINRSYKTASADSIGVESHREDSTESNITHSGNSVAI